MDDTKRLLGVRKVVKNRKPSYMRQTGWKKDKLDKKWIRPRGAQSKLRERKRGHGHRPEPGYGSPRAVRGLSQSGFEPCVICNVKDLKALDKKKQGVLISGAVGERKRVEIATEAKKLGLIILNMKDVDAYVKGVHEQLAKRKDARKSAIAAKSEKEKKAEKKAEEKKKEEEKGKESDDEKKKAEKEEKDKVLTSK